MSTEREQRYAEAISEASGIAAHRPQVLKEAGAVMAVADAEIEQAEGRVAEWQREAVAAEAEVARLTTLLEQRTAALTRTIDAKNAAEAQIARMQATHLEWAVKRSAPYEGVLPCLGRQEAQQISANLAAEHGGEWPVVSRNHYVDEWQEIQ